MREWGDGVERGRMERDEGRGVRRRGSSIYNT